MFAAVGDRAHVRHDNFGDYFQTKELQGRNYVGGHVTSSTVDDREGGATGTTSGSALLLFFAPAGGLHVLERGWRQLPDGGRLIWQRLSTPGGAGMQTRVLALGSALSSTLAAALTTVALPPAAVPSEARLPRPLRWGVGWQGVPELSEHGDLASGFEFSDYAHELAREAAAASAQWDKSVITYAQLTEFRDDEASYDAATYSAANGDYVLLPPDNWDVDAGGAGETADAPDSTSAGALKQQQQLLTDLQAAAAAVVPDLDAALLALLVAVTAGVCVALTRSLLQLRDAVLAYAAVESSPAKLLEPLLLLPEGEDALHGKMVQRFYNPLCALPATRT